MDATNIVPDSQSGDQAVFSSKSAPPAKIPVTQVTYHGKSGQVFRLHLMNLFMNIITIGIYSFWGKTRIRRYMTSHVAILDDRFEYTGTGKELLFGWLKAMLIFMPLIVCMSIPYVKILGFIAFIGIFSIAIYLALRYRLSRTKWRGIRFSLAGSLKEYFVLSLKRTFINIFTLGYKIPKSDILLWSYIANNMSYGDLKFSYQGDASKLRKVHLITMSIFLVTILTCSVGPLVFIASQEMMKGTQEAGGVKIEQITTSPNTVTPIEKIDPQAGYEESDSYESTETYNQDIEVIKKPKFDGEMIGGIAMIYVGLGIALLSRLWYQAALWQEKFRGLYLGNIRFKADVTGGELAKLLIGNLLIIIFTLGLGRPIAANRTLRYYATHMRIGGDLKAMIARQQTLQQKSGMGDALAADVGFDMGL